MTKRPLSLLALILVCLAAQSWAEKKPNILVIVADDMGFADSGFQGCQDVATPNIDSLAKNGARFTNGYVGGCVCSPSRVGILTGRYQQRTGHNANPSGDFGLDSKEMTMAQRMKAAGYATGITGGTAWKRKPWTSRRKRGNARTGRSVKPRRDH